MKSLNNSLIDGGRTAKESINIGSGISGSINKPEYDGSEEAALLGVLYVMTLLIKTLDTPILLEIAKLY